MNVRDNWHVDAPWAQLVCSTEMPDDVTKNILELSDNILKENQQEGHDGSSMPVTFANEDGYNLIKEDDTFNFIDLSEFTEEKDLTLEVVHSDKTTDTIILKHSYNKAQIDWFRAGSALNLIREQNT